MTPFGLIQDTGTGKVDLLLFNPDIPFCACTLAGWLDILMVITLCIMLLAGFPVAFSLAGTALLFGLAGLAAGVFDTGFLLSYPQRIYGIITGTTLIAVPMFVLMGVILEKSGVAEELLESMAGLFGSLNGGLGISVMLVGVLLAASTGIVGATVVTMGLISLPVMLQRGYTPSIACGTIAAAGTLGQIIPPSIVLILLGDVISNAYQKMQLEKGIYAPETVSVGDLFAGAILPGLLLVGLYLLWQIAVSLTAPRHVPAIPPEERGSAGQRIGKALRILPAPLLLIIAVLGSILAGIATPTEAASVGVAGALLIAGARTEPGKPFPAARRMILAAAASLMLICVLNAFLDLRTGLDSTGTVETAGFILAVILSVTAACGLIAGLVQLRRRKVLFPVADQSVRVIAMVFAILLGAALFTLVFRGLGGEETVKAALDAAPGGLAGALFTVMLVMFILGFFLDFIEITLVVVPLVSPHLLAMGLDPVWLGVMMAINLQTSFLTPPFGFALFYLRGVAPQAVETRSIYKGALPYIFIQVCVLGILAFFPGLATWLPDILSR